MSGFYWKLGRIVRAGPPYMPADLAVDQLVKYGHLGEQLRYVSGPGKDDPTGFELFVPLGIRPEEQRKRLAEMSQPVPWERVHLWDPEPPGRRA